jgi:hypothetical protein
MAIKTQTSLTRWKRVNNIIIPKKKDARSLKYFQNIHIYEADWNAIMSIKWKEALKQSEDSNMLQPNQFKSRKQKSTMQHLQLEISQIEISRLSRQQYGQIYYDAISEVINPIQTMHQSLGINISPESPIITQQNQ